MAHNVAGASLTECERNQLIVSQHIVRQDWSHMLDRSQVFFEREQVATIAQLRLRLH